MRLPLYPALFLSVSWLAFAPSAATAQSAANVAPQTSAPSRPVVPPWVEAMSTVHATDAVPVVQGSGEQEWEPGLGALPQLANPFAGPSSGLIVNLATGNLTYLPRTDMAGSDTDGSEAVFTRSYRSELAQRGYGSPGLSAGWVHTWDVSGVAAEPGKSASIQLTYPNGVHETIPFDVGPNSQPTGKFTQPPGRPFAVTGSLSNTVPGVWEQFTILWRGNSRWTFVLGADRKTYVLGQINGLLLDWDNTRRIRSVRSVQKPKAFLLVFDYRETDGMLIGVRDANKRSIDYRYDTPPPSAGMGTAPMLTGVSQLHSVGETLSYRQAYGYTAADGKGVLEKVSVPNNGGYTTATVVYRNQKVAAMVDANNNRRMYTYLPTGTRVEVWGPTDTKPTTFRTENIDSLSRHTGTTDALGHSTHLGYGDSPKTP